MKLKKLIWFLFVVFITQNIFAGEACSDKTVDLIFKRVFPQAYEKSKKTMGEAISACKQIPNRSDRFIFASAIPTKSDMDITEYGLGIFIADIKGNVIESSFWGDKRIISDAMELQGISIDTAKYNVKPNLRAFGIRTYTKNNSSVTQLYEDSLSLFVSYGDKISPILDNLVTTSSLSDTTGGADCTLRTNQISRTITVLQNGRNGYADLLIKETNKNEETLPPKCITTHKKPTIKKKVISFNNGYRF